MPGLILGIAIAICSLQDAQSPPVFRSEAYVVANFLVMGNGHGKVLPGLTAADFSIVVEKISVPLNVAEHSDKPGHYVLSFNPPESLRDGKSHRIDVKFKSPDGKWKTLPMKWKAIFEKPK